MRRLAALTITIAGPLLLAVFQTVSVVRARFALTHEIAVQQPAIQQGEKLRVQLTDLTQQSEI